MARCLQLHVQLRDTPVWRRLRVRQADSLHDLHDALQAAFGWEDSHLFLFRQGGADRAVSPHYEDFEGERIPVASRVKIGALLTKRGDRCEYEYDFGDGWIHDIVVEQSQNGTADAPWLLDGELAGPPEDCGGVHGYERCAKFVRTGVDPYGEDPAELREWLGEWTPDEFDRSALPH